MQGEGVDDLMRSDVRTSTRETCHQPTDFPFATFCSKDTQASTDFDTCVGEIGSGLICLEGSLPYLRGVISRDCNGSEITQYTDISQIFNWIILSHLDETLKMIDNEFMRKFVLSALDLAAYLINTPKIADDFEVVKFLF